MTKNTGATKEQIEAILERFKQSGLTRKQYCEREGMTLYMLDYYHRRLQKLRQRECRAEGSSKSKPRIARVEVVGETSTAANPTGFALTLANGRRIEVNGWVFPESDLARLIQVAERA